MAQVRKKAKYAMAVLNVGYTLLGYKGCLKVVSLSWAKKKNDTGNAWTNV